MEFFSVSPISTQCLDLCSAFPVSDYPSSILILPKMILSHLQKEAIPTLGQPLLIQTSSIFYRLAPVLLSGTAQSKPNASLHDNFSNSEKLLGCSLSSPSYVQKYFLLTNIFCFSAYGDENRTNHYKLLQKHFFIL